MRLRALLCALVGFGVLVAMDGPSQAALGLPTTTTTVATSTTAKLRPTTTSTTTTVAPTPPAGSEPLSPGTTDRWLIEERIRWVWGDDGEHAARVACGESGFNPRARNGTFDGLFQIGWRYHSARIRRHGYERSDMYEAEPNIAVAWDLWQEQGRRPWSGYSTRCW